MEKSTSTVLAIAAISLFLIAFVYKEGEYLNKKKLLSLRIVLSFFCSAGSVFVWEVLNTAFYARSLFSSWQIDRIILVSGCLTLFFYFLNLHKLTVSGPVGFDLNRNKLNSNARSFVYADSIPIKGDGWVRR